MVKYYESIGEDLSEWAMKQAVFFTASAPTYGKHVNLSPKGLPSSSFSVLGPNLCAYVDATGSGNETISHIRENGRVTIMFCSFGPSPRILRFFCKGKVVEWEEEQEFGEWIKKMDVKPPTGARAVIVLDVFKVQTSCGFGVPYLSLSEDPQDPAKQIAILADRDTLGHWAGKQVEKGNLENYQAINNNESLDGLPGLRAARKQHGEKLIWLGDLKASTRGKARAMWQVGGLVVLIAMLSSLWTVLALWSIGLFRTDEALDWARRSFC